MASSWHIRVIVDGETHYILRDEAPGNGDIMWYNGAWWVVHVDKIHYTYQQAIINLYPQDDDFFSNRNKGDA